MNTATLATMVVICSFVWGGFAVLLVKALKSEGAKQGNEARD